MYPQYYNSGGITGDQSQINQVKRNGQVYHQDGMRNQPSQNPYSSVTMNAIVPGQQYDVNCVGNVNPSLNPNTSMQFCMVPNSYCDGMKTMPIQYDRSTYSYPMQMQMMEPHPNGFNNVSPYISYYGMQPGVPFQPVDRQSMPMYIPDYQKNMNRDKPVQSVGISPLGVGISRASSGKASVPLNTEEIPLKRENMGDCSGGQSSIPTSHPDNRAYCASVADNDINNNIKASDMQLATMLLQIKGKSKESFVPSSTPIPMRNPAVSSDASISMQGNRQFAYNRPLPAIEKVDDKRTHFDPNYLRGGTVDPSLYQQYKMPSAGQRCLPKPSPQSARYSGYSFQSGQSTSTQSSIIPSPTPVQKNIKSVPASAQDYYVFCTACRHGTPINVMRPIPDTFKCSNCGLSCALDKHLLAYYNLNIPAIMPAETEPKQTETKEASVISSPVPSVGIAKIVPLEQSMKDIVSTVKEEVEKVDAIEVESGEMPTPTVPLISIDSLVFHPEETLSPEELQILADRPSFRDSDESQLTSLTDEEIETLLQQCKTEPREWWVGKYVKVELPLSKLSAGDVIERDGEEGRKEEVKRSVVGEVVGMSETGFVVKIADDSCTDTVIVDDFVCGLYGCWLLLKEGYKNLVIC